jgi:phage repressor protein C with HTH and peptisase S24 domain
MEPFIKIGDVICIDRSDKEIKRTAICAIRKENGSIIRKVERKGNILIISSGIEDVENIDPDDPYPIIGKGIWIWRSLR